MTNSTCIACGLHSNTTSYIFPASALSASARAGDDEGSLQLSIDPARATSGMQQLALQPPVSGLT
jgi:hypothetical protein